jgi:hypothetical protein
MTGTAAVAVMNPTCDGLLFILAEGWAAPGPGRPLGPA